MAIYHLHTDPISRSEGRSATASSAYRAGEKLEDKRTGKVFDYSKRGGVVSTKCFLVKDDEIQEIDRSELWNLAEQREKRKDSRTAREVILNIPFELSESEREKLVDDFAIKLAKQFGVAIDYAIHLPDKEGDQRNHHAHILMTTRNATYENSELKLHDKTSLEMANARLKKLNMPKTQDQITAMRKDWQDFANRALEENGIDARIDHRSYEEQGINKIPTVKMGWKAMKFERLGFKTPTGDINRKIKKDNESIEELEEEIQIHRDELFKLKNAPKQHLDLPDFSINIHKKNAIQYLYDAHNNLLDNLSNITFTEFEQAVCSIYKRIDDCLYSAQLSSYSVRKSDFDNHQKALTAVIDVYENTNKVVNRMSDYAPSISANKNINSARNKASETLIIANARTLERQIDLSDNQQIQHQNVVVESPSYRP